MHANFNDRGVYVTTKVWETITTYTELKTV